MAWTFFFHASELLFNKLFMFVVSAVLYRPCISFFFLLSIRTLSPCVCVISSSLRFFIFYFFLFNCFNSEFVCGGQTAGFQQPVHIVTRRMPRRITYIFINCYIVCETFLLPRVYLLRGKRARLIRCCCCCIYMYVVLFFSSFFNLPGRKGFVSEIVTQ